ncbi:Lrp/AsnC family transcriptional regulator [Actinoallomurus iriomotensis]|uniref:AsnC family transcriptional regulator n=1 Tax=Actinoallomurus iriomotensis TaxID=478107 RepID=A0A9W6RDD5_9ACTN|nr:Lrp/AsnC family transcriptional regulator [Actinoallomurus iriomotensis]GLY71860.1 AsnC family transcriptional regulator [Actinoallomurus iriomotensis]
MESVILDDLDRRLVHALNIDPRAPFGRIADVLGVSDQTIARRYRRLRASGLVRVVGSVDTARLGYTTWVIRLRCTPDAAGPVSAALARRTDTFWVHLLSGGTEIACGTTVRTAEERGALLLQRLPRTGRVSSVTAHSQLHLYVGGRITWPGAVAALSAEEADRLRPEPPPPPGEGPVVLDDGDRALLDALALDGRTGHAELAAATGWSESTVRRRMDRLVAGGVLFYDVDVPPEALGYHAEARLWMSVRPAHLASVGRALAGHVEVTFAAATTGPTNLMAGVVCRDDQALYRYLTERIGALEGVERLETAPVIRTVKRGGPVLKP